MVDMNCHLNIGAAEALIRSEIVNPPNPAGFSSPASDAVMGKLFATIGPKLNDIDLRIADMDALGVDVQALSPVTRPVLLFRATGAWPGGGADRQ